MDLSKISHENERLYISNSGLQRLASIYDVTNPHKNVEWTTDFTVELPIKLKQNGNGYFIVF